jgi:hypothetical protein
VNNRWSPEHSFNRFCVIMENTFQCEDSHFPPLYFDDLRKGHNVLTTAVWCH